jgi:hypothetical protein
VAEHSTLTPHREGASQSDVLSRATRALRDQFQEVVDDGVQTCIKGVPALADPDLRATLVTSVEVNVADMLRLLEAEAQLEPDRVPDEALALARDLVHLGAEQQAIHQGYRVGHHWFQGRMLAAAAAEASDAQELYDASVRITNWCHSWFDVMHDLLAAVHAAEEARWRPSGAALRAAAIGSVLNGTCDDIDAASLTLGYELRSDHVAVIAWQDGPMNPVQLRSAAAAALQVTADARPLVHEASSAVLWLWFPARAVPRSVGLDGKDVHLALGQPRLGVDGFRHSHEDARHARRVTVMHGGPAPTVRRFQDIELVALVTSDPERSDLFVRDALGPLAAPDLSAQRLRETLLVVFEEPSISAAASRLDIHPNTVVYRIRKAEGLLGRSLDTGGLRLHAALNVCESLALFRG